MTNDRTNPIHDKALLDDNKRVAPPSHRHAAPSAPWPWIDITDNVDRTQLETDLPPVPEPCTHHIHTCDDCWKGYPQSLYPNWTPEQVGKSKIRKAIKDYRRDVKCVLYQVDVDRDGFFKVPQEGKIESDDSKLENTWHRIINSKIPHDNRVRAIFVENMSGPVLQMLGAKYNIEPFFFSSSLNWIPSRYQEQIKPGEGDHITICLTFLRSVPDGGATSMSAASPYANDDGGASVNRSGNIRMNIRRKKSNLNANTSSTTTLRGGPNSSLTDQMIDTQAPLVLKSNGRLLVLDLLSVHLIRRAQGSVIISYHADKDLPTTTAPYLHTRIRFAGQSVYWQSIFQLYNDPTFVLLTFIWHALYAWDEALENLYSHICSLESRVMNTSDMELTRELHVIRAHHMHYSSLLDDFTKTVEFVRDTSNPALEVLSEAKREANAALLNRECDNLLTEIARLEAERRMQDRRLKNVMNLVFSSVNIIDSRRMQKMTEAASKDSAAMKQIAYLTMVFLPASFVAAVFGMNVEEIVPHTHGTLSHYVSTAIPFTLVTIWIIIAFQSKYVFENGVSIWTRLAWPVMLPAQMISTRLGLRGAKKTDGNNLDVREEKVYGAGNPGRGRTPTTAMTIAEAMESVQRL